MDFFYFFKKYNPVFCFSIKNQSILFCLIQSNMEKWSISLLLLWFTSCQGDVLEQFGDLDGLYCWVAIVFFLLSTYTELPLGDIVRHTCQVLVIQSFDNYSKISCSLSCSTFSISRILQTFLILTYFHL